MSENNYPWDKQINTRNILIIVFFIGSIGITCYSTNVKNFPALSIIGNSVLFAGGAFFIGALLGFLFGIPRTLQGEAANKETESDNKNNISYKVNTNLEQISDWLTKVLVG